MMKTVRAAACGVVVAVLSGWISVQPAAAAPVSPWTVVGCWGGKSFFSAWSSCSNPGITKYRTLATCNSGADVYGPWKPPGNTRSRTSPCYSGVRAYATITV